MIRIAFLDDLALTALKENMFTPERPAELLSAIPPRARSAPPPLTAASQVLSSASIEPQRIAAFSELMRDLLDNGETPTRKVYLRMLIGAIIVGDKSVKIVGSKETPERPFSANPAPPKRSWFGTEMAERFEVLFQIRRSNMERRFSLLNSGHLGMSTR